jgi:hypothetical protein
MNLRVVDANTVCFKLIIMSPFHSSSFPWFWELGIH